MPRPAGRAEHAVLSAPSALVGRTVAEVERELIVETLRHCSGNRTHAADILGISIRTLRNKLREYSARGIAVPVPEHPGRSIRKDWRLPV
jgi:DNA-binding NtrC family response regulator